MRFIQGSSKLGWRIRDEYIYRKGDTINGKFVKRRGGYYNAKDAIAKWSDLKLKQMVKRVKGDS